MYLITVIIPVYNAEKYLKRCIESVINQSIGFENIELILADDNSSDNSKNIIQEYSDKYSNIISFFSNTNHGFPGYGRNIALKNASAKYIMFMDNDDEYELDFCETVYNEIEKRDCDIVSTNYKFIEGSVVTLENNFSNINKKYIDHGDFRLVELDEFYNIPDVDIWTKIFKRSIIQDNNILFVEDRLNEDTQFLFNYLFYANKLIYIDYYGYKHYRDGENLSYFTSKNTLAFIDSYYDLLNLVKDKYGDVDMVYLFKNKIETTLYRIILSSNRKCLLEKLYEFEMNIGFNSPLNHFWSTMCNKLLLKQRFSLVIFILKILKQIKDLLDFLRTKKIL